MSSQTDNPDSQQEIHLSPDELFGLAMVDWAHVDKARETAPADMLQEYRSLLEKGSNPNLMVEGYHVASSSLRNHAENPYVISAHHLYSTELLGRFLERMRIEARNFSHDGDLFELEQLKNIRNKAVNPTGLDRHLYRIFHPLADAACCLDHRRIEMLIEYGANLRGQLYEDSEYLSRRMTNPFLPAIRAQDEDLVRTLLRSATPSHGLTLSWTREGLADLVEAAGDRNHAQLRIGDMLLQYGASIDCVRFLEDRARSYIRLWLEYPIAAGDSNRSSLQIATGDINTNNLQHLIDQQADVNARDVVGMSPLLEAVYYGHSEAVRILVSHGADVQQRAGEQVCTLQKLVVERKSNPPRKFCYDRRLFDVGSFVKDRWPALHIAAQRGFPTIARILLMNGADIAAREQMGRTALDVAIQCSNLDTAFVLLSVTSNFEAHLDSGTQLMASAIDNWHIGSIKILMDNGVHPPDKEWPQDAFQSQIADNHTATPTYLPEVSTVSFWSQENRDLSTSTFLCWECLPKLAAFGVKKTSLIELHRSPNCRFCQLLDDCKQAQSRKEPIVSWYYIHSTKESGCQLFIKIDDTTYLHNVRRITDDWHRTIQTLEPLEDQGTGSSAAVALSKHWIEKCIRTHAKCNSQSMKRYFPTRVVSIHSESLKIVHDPAMCAPYVALSHRWGTESLPQTLSTNVQSRMKSLELGELTKTMQDAISITRRLGYQYLWIDALCIIQDSEEDWLQESAKMSEVFSGAVVTIAVADAESHSQGIIRPRVANCLRPFAVPFLEQEPYRERVEYDGEGVFYVFPNTSRVSAGPRQKGTLDTRGWILQEQMLSRRILYFGGGEIFWDCNTVSASESSPMSTSLLQDENPDETWALKTIRRTLSEVTNLAILRQKLADVWTELIKNYSSRQLTHQKDRLIALQGILRPLSQLLNEEPVAGMWRSELWRQLLWWIPQQSLTESSSIESAFLAPSWSWLCARGPVTYHNSLATQQKKQDINGRAVTSKNFTDLESQFTIKSVDSQTLPDGRGVTGSMTISGPSFPYLLTPKDLKMSGVKRFNASKWKLNSGNWLLDHSVELPLHLHCIVVAEDTVAKMLVCLCVVQTESSDQWQRIGLCHWEGLTWQISKYAGKAAEKRTFTIV